MKVETLKYFRSLIKAALEGKFGGDTFDLPPEHRAGMRVPKGGSSCANCKFLVPGNKCKNEYWVAWHGGDNKIPAPADEYCSDFYEPRRGTMEK